MNHIRSTVRRTLAGLLAVATLAAGTAAAESLPVTRLPVIEVRAALPTATADAELLARAPVRLPTITVHAKAPAAPARRAHAATWPASWLRVPGSLLPITDWRVPARTGAAWIAHGLACQR